ncbi:pyridoxal phosphate-dependent decarboxylase family protein [Gemmatimonas sp.]|jgi:aromatic-L-amino-acid decarboxylase|uniref:pyridoxal phosphate-dependent decarboxylase family protein n=1 Tax=Gemmatimonas sp. TaxID=1962908 RepID=UPI0037C123CD
MTLPPLDPQDWEQYRALAHRMVDESLDYLRDVRDRPTWTPMPPPVRERLTSEPLPRSGVGDVAVYEEFLADIRPYPNGNIHPRFWGWVMGTGTPQAAMEDFLASVMNPNVGGFEQSPVLVERQVIKWCAELMGFPDTAGGILVSGGTLANDLCLAVARQKGAGFDVRAEGLQGGHPTLLVYGSTETHGWLKKGCELLGLGAAAFRRVPVLDDFTVNVAEMEAMIVADRAAGHRPICIVGTAGTVQTGATDDLEALADLAARQQLWFHVDGAFGSMAALSPDTAAQVKGQERADSIAFDLHKWGYLPFDVACVLVRHDADLVETFSAQGAYLSSEKRGVMAQSGVFFADRGVELTRSFKALKVWMRLRAIGTDTLGQHIARNVAQAHRLAALVQAHPELELLAPAPLNIVNLRYTAPGLDDTALDALNREILISLQEDGVAVPSGTVIRSRFAIRVAIANHRSNDADFDALVEAVVQRGRSLTVVR